ncbi:hypothetical protein GE21DRAFT_1127706 [Neurospora crassa]|nr:hypothetical protein GE21DRAFT_1127706 [Neurospora crassa]
MITKSFPFFLLLLLFCWVSWVGRLCSLSIMVFSQQARSYEACIATVCFLPLVWFYGVWFLALFLLLFLLIVSCSCGMGSSLWLYR